MDGLIKLFLPFLFAFSFSVHATSDAPTLKTVSTLLEITNADDYYVGVFQAMVKEHAVEMTTGEAMKTDMVSKDIIAKELLPIYQKYYTEKELLELITFLNSPLGKKMAQADRNIMNDAFGAADEFGKKVSSTK
ncbi:DUF2059 domain-containing protein [Thalassotalea nanhaiensis]|uniref:DUF2059 domain-containing protein n=1 Tax=Thalassotalea nanhaiensis TaxID=3065648 RepID=A0ABY9TFC3_9GAMM|nr:DUF2059 domain-containing protein [Colwelliaceae bacterium SQ345]